MAHAATWGYHNMPWKKEMIRLREAGAPLSGSDRIVSLNDRNGRAISKKLFRGVMEDPLLDVPTVNLNQAIKWFIHEQGAPPEHTIKGFLKRYPWARQIFRTAKTREPYIPEAGSRATPYACQKPSCNDIRVVICQWHLLIDVS